MRRPEPGAAAARAIGPLALPAVVALGLALRLWHLGQGLPDFIEEAIPFRRAFEMWGWNTGRSDLNPHLFHYPSLTFYLQFLLQKLHVVLGHLLGTYASPADYWVAFQTDPTPMVTLGRLVGIAAEVVVMLAAWRIGERLRRGAGLLAALLVACAPTLIATSRSIYADPVMGAFALAALERMLAWRERGGAGRLVAAVMLVGLATGAKYPAVVLLLPLAWVMWTRERAGAAWRWAVAVAGVAGVFLLTTPFALLDPATFRRDLSFVERLASEGHLGHLAGGALGFHLAGLARNLGWPAVLLLPVALGLALARIARRPRAAAAHGAHAGEAAHGARAAAAEHDAGRAGGASGARSAGGDLVAVWLALLAFALPMTLARLEAERYLVPVLPLAGLLAAAAALELAALLPARARSAGRIAGTLALALPALAVGTAAGAAGRDSTQLAARRWCEAQLGPDALMVEEAYGAQPLTRVRALEVMSAAPFRSASPEARRRFLARRWLRVVQLPLSVAGRSSSRVQPPEGPAVEIEIFPHAADFNRLVYDPRVLNAVDYVLTSSAVRERFAADTVRFGAERSFYRLLDEHAEQAVRFRSGAGVMGPEIAIYRLGAAGRAAAAAAGRLDPLWWTRAIPDAYRRRVEAVLPDAWRTGGAPRTPRGAPAPWVQSLAAVYEERLRPFAQAMALNLAELDRLEPAREFSAATLEVLPGDAEACLLYATASGRAGRWGDARAALERSLAWLEPAGGAPAFLRLEYAEVLAQVGQPEAARSELRALLVGAAPDDPITAAAERMLADLAGRR